MLYSYVATYKCKCASTYIKIHIRTYTYSYKWVKLYKIYLYFLCRIDSIEFRFSLAAQYQEYDVEEYNPIDAVFFITVTMENILHGSSMHTDVTFYRDPLLKRLCRSFRNKSTIVDIFVMILLILSSWTYVTSIIKTVKLAKVRIVIEFIIICI